MIKCDPKHQTKTSEDFLCFATCPDCCCSKSQVSDYLQHSKAMFVNVYLPSSQEELINVSDMAYSYAIELHLHTLAWVPWFSKGGDHNKMLLYWKLLLPVFQYEGHYNYVNEGFMLLMKTQWIKTENMQDRQGQNITTDYLEQITHKLNCLLVQHV